MATLPGVRIESSAGNNEIVESISSDETTRSLDIVPDTPSSGHAKSSPRSSNFGDDHDEYTNKISAQELAKRCLGPKCGCFYYALCISMLLVSSFLLIWMLIGKDNG